MTVSKYLSLDATAGTITNQEVKDTDVQGTTPGAIPFVDTSPQLAEDASNFFWDAANKRLGVGTNTPAFPITQFSSQPTFQAQIALAGNSLGSRIVQNNVATTLWSFVRGRGLVLATPSAPLTGDLIANLGFFGYTGVGTGAASAGAMRASVIEPAPGAGKMGGQWVIQLSPLGSASPVEVVRLEADTGLSMFGTNPVIDQNRIVRRRVFATLADLTTLVVAPVEGMEAAIQDANGTPAFGGAASGGGIGHYPVRYDGSQWVYG